MCNSIELSSNELYISCTCNQLKKKDTVQLNCTYLWIIKYMYNSFEDRFDWIAPIFDKLKK